MRNINLITYLLNIVNSNTANQLTGNEYKLLTQLPLLLIAQLGKVTITEKELYIDFALDVHYEDIGIGNGSISYTLNKLTEKGYLKRHRGGRATGANRYFIPIELPNDNRFNPIFQKYGIADNLETEAERITDIRPLIQIVEKKIAKRMTEGEYKCYFNLLVLSMFSNKSAVHDRTGFTIEYAYKKNLQFLGIKLRTATTAIQGLKEKGFISVEQQSPKPSLITIYKELPVGIEESIFYKHHCFPIETFEDIRTLPLTNTPRKVDKRIEQREQLIPKIQKLNKKYDKPTDGYTVSKVVNLVISSYTFSECEDAVKKVGEYVNCNNTVDAIKVEIEKQREQTDKIETLDINKIYDVIVKPPVPNQIIDVELLELEQVLEMDRSNGSFYEWILANEWEEDLHE